MMAARRIAHLMVSLAVLAAAASGCGTTAPSRFYTLDATAVADGAAPLGTAIMVGPVSIPAAVDRPEFVVQTAPNRVDIDEFNRWAAPLNDGIAQAVAGDLVKLLGTPNVAAAPMANFDPAYRVTIDVQRFDSVQGQSALLEAVWTVHQTAGGADPLGPHGRARGRAGRRLRRARRRPQPRAGQTERRHRRRHPGRGRASRPSRRTPAGVRLVSEPTPCNTCAKPSAVISPRAGTAPCWWRSSARSRFGH